MKNNKIKFTPEIVFLLIAFAGIPAFWYAYYLILPNLVDPLWLRLALGGSALVFALVMLFAGLSEKTNKILFQIWMYVGFSWFVYVVYVNNAHPYYVFAELIWAIVLTSFFEETTSLLIFSLFFLVSSILAVSFLPNPLMNKVLFDTMISLAFFVNYFNLAARIKLKRNLEKSEKSFRVIFDESADGLFLLSATPPRIVMDCNTQAIKIFGYKDKSELVGKGRDEIFKEGLTPEDSQAIEGELQKSGFWRKSMQVVSHGGTSFWADMVVREIRFGEQPVLLVRISDVTFMRRNEEELRKKNMQLEEVNKVMVGRELRMAELKKENEELRKRP